MEEKIEKLAAALKAAARWIEQEKEERNLWSADETLHLIDEALEETKIGPTPGPWEVQDRDEHWATIGGPADRGQYIAKVADWMDDAEIRQGDVTPRSREENAANVRLVRAAPVLYEFVKNIMEPSRIPDIKCTEAIAALDVIAHRSSVLVREIVDGPEDGRKYVLDGGDGDR